MDNALARSQSFEHILTRIRQKKGDYVRYNFSREQNDLLRTFFDLAQEFDGLEDFYCICVGVPREFMRLESRLYLLDEQEAELRLACDSKRGLPGRKTSPPEGVTLADESYSFNDAYIIPIHKKPLLNKEHPFQIQSKVVGLFQVSPLPKLSPDDLFFLSKYVNRIGYNLYNRQIANQNINHLRFINNLVMDIEHNVITPNMYFKHLFKELRKSINEMGELEALVRQMKSAPQDMAIKCETVISNITSVYQKLLVNLRQLEEYHANTSLFLESLFRKDHFEQGHLVLRPKLCSIEKEIILPQLEQYEKRFVRRGITIEKPTDMLGEMVLLNVDVGLLAQVYANLFSNAVKYTAEVFDRHGQPRKVVAYGREIIRNFFGIGNDAIKCNVYTTGPHLSKQEAQSSFTDGFRGESGKKLPGTGHGLSFVRQVVEMHGGLVGYEPTEGGNNFYFILPLPEQGDVTPPGQGG